MSVTYKIKKTRARVSSPESRERRRDKSTTKEEEGRRKKERQD
jgi:hypothetical protein